PPLQELQLSNGLHVMLMEKHQVPVVQINVIVDVGTANDPTDRIGLASMVADMMDEGAGKRDALELADAVDFLGARLSTGAGTSAMSASLYVAVDKLGDALPILADVVLRPTFPTDELERKRASRLTSLLQAFDEPRMVASVLFAHALYGDHPYGNSPLGTDASIHALSVGDLQRFHEVYFTANNATVIVVGDVTRDGIVPQLERAFGGWATGDVPSTDLAAVPAVGRREILLVDKPGAAQSEIRIGRIAAPRLTDDYYALQVLNTVLGGSFTSRLNQNLREDKGWTYGAGSSFGFRALAGPFLASSAVQTDVTAQALEEFFKEFDAIRQPVPAEEMERAKNYEALGFPSAFQSVRGIASSLGEIAEYDLPRDYLNHYVDRILAVTQREVRDAARMYITPDRFVVVVVGDREKIEPGIRALNLGTVRVLSVEDVLGPKPAM
ncbi:MAG: insulinase family protein, partial [Gemmatimonadales bacterium]|nr:insulinase family protein [Gemmatimonadales bacterium]